MEYNLEGITTENIGEIVNNDKNSAKQLFIDIAQKIELLKNEQEHLIKRDSEINNSIELLNLGVNAIFKHLQLEKPLAVICEDRLLVISERSITFEYNIL